MNRIDFDDSALPMIEIRFHGVPSDQQFEAYLARIEANLERGDRSGAQVVMMFDARKSGLVPASIRRRQADWMAKHKAQSARVCLGYAFVIDSPAVRGALTAILWLAPMPAPHRVVATPAEARSWLQSLLPA